MKKLLLSALVLIAVFAAVLGTTQSAKALNCNDPSSLTAQESIQCGACGASGNVQCANDTLPGNSKTASNHLSNTVKKILNLMSAAVAIISIVMIIVGGARFVSSGGKAESVSAARGTIMYALIGLLIVALAQVMVHFVINNVT